MELVTILERARHARNGGGAAMFGDDLSRWPAWAVDALVVVEQERIKEHNARLEAELAETENG